MTGAETAHGGFLDPLDLIDDREIGTPDADRLEHERIADQLDRLVSTVPAPSNVALYGPWGSGKTGVGRLLRSRVESRPGHRFARFDAFKYAETPLRRNFISAVATELENEDRRFHEDLYADRTSTDLSLPAAKWWKIIGIFAAILAALTVVLLVIVGLVALAGSGDVTYWDRFRELAKSALASGLAPAALLAGLIALASKSLQADHSTAHPDSDEQFEALFRKLVNKSRAERLVVFVDELDRCAAGEVVATLDAVRTFLGVEKCVFVIAADQRVLEEALTQAARQETPPDDVSPYYSTGNAYLDKVFQYQVSLPPLLSQSVTRFAADLVKDRGGVWGLLDTDYVVSILIPTHVTSPRRVKHLLNAYALAFRLAQERHRQGVLAEDPVDCAAALARLVCLRVEFPLFARNLTADARLPQLVLDLYADPKAQWDFGVSPHVRSLALRYANGTAAPARLLTDASDEVADHAVAEESTRQLLTYLRRTRAIRGPSRDLVFLHSTGSDFGIDGATATTAEEAAQNGDAGALSGLLDASDEAEKIGVLQLVLHQMRTAVGVEATNAVRALLGVVANDVAVPLAPIADIASEVIAATLTDDHTFLNEETAGPAWSVAAAGANDGSRELRRRILAKAAAADTEIDTAFLLESPGPALEVAPDAFGKIVTALLVSDHVDAARQTLANLEDSELTQVLSAARSPLVASMKAAFAALDEWKKTQSAADAAVPAARAAAAATAPGDEEDDEPFDPGRTVAALQGLAEQDPATRAEFANLVIRTLVSVDRQTCRDAVEAILGGRGTESIEDQATIAAILGPAGAQRRTPGLVTRWVRAVKPSAIETAHASVLSSLATSVWTKLLSETEVKADLRRGAVSSLATLIEQLPDGTHPDLTDTARQAFKNAWAKDAKTAAHQTRAIDAIGLMAQVSLLEPGLAYNEATRRIQDSLTEPQTTPVTRDDELGAYLFQAAMVAVRGANLHGSEGRQVISSILKEASSSTWLASPDLEEWSLTLVSASGLPAEELNFEVPGEEIEALAAAHGPAASTSAALWFTVFRPGRSEAVGVLQALVEARALDASVAAAMQTTCLSWPADERQQLLRARLAAPDIDVPSALELEAIGFHASDPEAITDLLVERLGTSTNNTQRQTVVDLWARAQITDDTATRRFIEGVAIPLFELNAGGGNSRAAVLGLNALDAVSKLPYGVKTRLGLAVEAAVRDSDLEKRALRVMSKLGYARKRSGLLGRKERPDYG